MLTQSDLKEMVSPAGFLRVFYRYLRVQRETCPTLSQRAAFEALNDAYEAEYEVPRFPSYDAFKKFLSRRYKIS